MASTIPVGTGKKIMAFSEIISFLQEEEVHGLMIYYKLNHEKARHTARPLPCLLAPRTERGSPCRRSEPGLCHRVAASPLWLFYFFKDFIYLYFR